MRKVFLLLRNLTHKLKRRVNSLSDSKETFCCNTHVIYDKSDCNLSQTAKYTHIAASVRKNYENQRYPPSSMCMYILENYF